MEIRTGLRGNLVPPVHPSVIPLLAVAAVVIARVHVQAMLVCPPVPRCRCGHVNCRPSF